MILKITNSVWRQGLVAIGVLLAACSAKPSGPGDGGTDLPDDGGMGVSRAQVVTAAADCAVQQAQAFREAAQALKTAVEALASAPDAARLAAARAAFGTAADAWQINEALQFGPAAASSAIGGGDLRDQINPWPLRSRCAVEELMVSRGYENGVRNQLVIRRGFPALEYLLFYEGDDTACEASSAIVAQGTWAALSTAERGERRRAYARAVATDVAGWADTLVSEWEASFRQTLTSAGPGNALFKSTQAALNVVSDAVFYVDPLKDLKLARPLGLRDCATAPCLDQLESPFAGRSKRNVAQNLDGLRRLLRGCGPGYAGVGFDDLLLTVGATATAETLLQRSDAIQAALDAVSEPDFKEAIVAHPDSVRAVHTAAKSLTDLLKSEFITVLDLELPKSLEGDND